MLDKKCLSRGLLSAIAFVAISCPVISGNLTLYPSESATIHASDSSGETKGLVKFDLTSIPDTSRIDLAVLEIVYSSEISGDSTIDIMVGACQDEWISPRALSGELPVPDTLLVEAVGRVGQRQVAKLNVTDIVAFWNSGRGPNQGFVVSAVSRGASHFELLAPSSEPRVVLTVYYSHDNRPKKAN